MGESAGSDLGMIANELVEVPGQSSVKKSVLLLLLRGVELVEQLDRQCNVEATRLESHSVEAAAVEEGNVFDGLGLPFPLHVVAK